MKIRPCSALNRGVLRRNSSLPLRALASLVGAAIGTLMLLASVSVPAADTAAPDHALWNELLGECVVAIDDGHSTAVDYDCFVQQNPKLQRYLDTLAAYDRAAYDSWSRNARLAFLINAYNAWTVELILSAWPDLESIRDLGSLLRSPWKKSIATLLGSTLSLDDIEHGMIREKGAFDDPRIHFAVNCASVGCPALRREAYRAADLDVQLEEQTRAFLADRSRNRLRDGRLEVSSIFTWYRSDFEQNWRGQQNLRSFLAAYAPALDLTESQSAELLAGDLAIRFLDYDWRLNSTGPR